MTTPTMIPPALLLATVLLLLPGCQDPPVPADFSPQVQLTAVAEEGDAEAQYALAVAYATGEFGDPDPTAFEYWLRRAAESGLTRAEEQLGQFLLQQATPEAEVEAVGWFQRAALANDPRAQHSLGLMYATGRGVDEDLLEAYVWINLAVDQGNEAAQRARAKLVDVMDREQLQTAHQRFYRYSRRLADQP